MTDLSSQSFSYLKIKNILSPMKESYGLGENN